MADEASTQQAPTQYVVLKRVTVDTAAIVREDQWPDGYDHGSDEGDEAIVWVPVLNQTAAQGRDGDVRIVEARSNREACKIATKGDDDRQRPGAYKAVPLRSWRGGVEYEEETRTVTVTRELED